MRNLIVYSLSWSPTLLWVSIFINKPAVAGIQKVGVDTVGESRISQAHNDQENGCCIQAKIQVNKDDNDHSH